MDMQLRSSDDGLGTPAPVPAARQAVALAPALAAMAYPFWLRAFHASGPQWPLAALPLLAAFAMPLLAALLWLRAAGAVPGSAFELRTRRLALMSVAAPPLFVFCAFLLSVLGRPVAEPLAWVVAWLTAGLWAWAGSRRVEPPAAQPADATARVAHGLLAAMLLAFVAFHLANHLFGLLGPQAHAAVMKVGRGVYRLPAVEAMLVALLLLQLSLGSRLAWRWSRQRMDGYRAVQVATGVYLGFFLLTHMNSALVSARALQGIATDWAWASGAPQGLLLDAWNIRLLPHYALGVFCVLAHLCCGLRSVLLAHGRPPAGVNRVWLAGLAVSASVSVAIVAGLCGLRITGN
ncbi:succinate dehydrogenase/fumarate reductase cytochrome b subunit [Pelomonas saccharophila]|uniref:Succinate dehydrogenase/fumarate reductase cytochrome b subunit n=1 Tax=Roseateles saccharophilus TaxID=304 RepID=A0ABU1YHR4_ROSSA|nr:hypothetical protein [Roseateles saccharophilus]MDR7268402.1 succinate dehydrogenase/fumarate reductase cytochrome b subunit [Roseateles saccharophilus]